MNKQTLRLIAPLALLPFAWQAPEAALPLDAAVTPDGAVFLLESTGPRTLNVKVSRGAEETNTAFDLSELPEEAAIIEAKVVPFDSAGGSDFVALAMVIEEGDTHTYRFLTNLSASEDHPFALSKSIFESQGEPFDIINARATGSSADGLEITFRRGKYSIRTENQDIEELVYIDTCSLAGLAGSKLKNVRTGEQSSPRMKR